MKLTCKNQLHVYTLTVNNLKRKLIIPLTIASKRIKHLGIHLTKEAKYCTLKTTKHCRYDIHIHGLEYLILLRWYYHPKLSLASMKSLSKSQRFLFAETEKFILKLTWNLKGPLNGQNNLEKEQEGQSRWWHKGVLNSTPPVEALNGQLYMGQFPVKEIDKI